MKSKIFYKMSSMVLSIATVCGAWVDGGACTGISLTAKDGSYIQARTIEWTKTPMQNKMVIIPIGKDFTSYTPSGVDGLTYTSKYGVVGLCVEDPHFIAEGLNSAGLSCGLFFFPKYGSYMPYEYKYKDISLADLQVNEWILTQFANVDQVIKGMESVRITGLQEGVALHWRIGDWTGRQIVMEIVNGEVKFFENSVGVITNAPGFEWHLSNLSNYVNLFPGTAPSWSIGNFKVEAIGGSSGMLGLPGDATPPSRFIRAAFFRATAPVLETGEETVLQSFHLLNSFDIPLAIEHNADSVLPNMPSTTQWTSAIDLTNLKVYYHTSYNINIRCIDLNKIDFRKVKYQELPLDKENKQPIEMVEIK
ncbi:MAG: linear amide C-N hydrolase [Bacteroidia bacterium]|nr:linear amide C-N hydrolase [Bacteroidia bacterium]